jgi:hypothetical protein
MFLEGSRHGTIWVSPTQPAQEERRKLKARRTNQIKNCILTGLKINRQPLILIQSYNIKDFPH